MTKPLVHTFPNANGATVLDSQTRNLAQNLAEVIRAAVARSDNPSSAAAALGVPVGRLSAVAKRYGVKLPWNPSHTNYRAGGR